MSAVDERATFYMGVSMGEAGDSDGRKRQGGGKEEKGGNEFSEP